MRKITFSIPVLAIFILMPFSASACNVRPHALSQINKIHKVFGGKKPKLVIEKGSDKDAVAFYNKSTGTIRLFKEDYPGKCSDEIPYLKSIISHEYAHHISKELKKVTKLKGERLAYLAEHSIGDAIFGYDAVDYDNDTDLEHPTAYEAIKTMISKKQIKHINSGKNKVSYAKKRISK